jgi:predicted acetyltransferase
VDLEIRPIRDDELDRYLTAIESAFHQIPTADDLRVLRELTEVDRTLAVFDGPDIVGSAAADSLQLTIPGGIVPMAGVTAVAVVPSHRRRGILTELMHRQLEDVHRRGEPVAGLWASEGGIYQRFGYGLATLHSSFAIDRTRTAFARQLAPDPGRVRMVPREQALEAMPPVYERIRPTIPGFLDRSSLWWDRLYADLERDRRGAGPLLFALHESPESVDGFLAYRVKDDWSEGWAAGHAMIHELIAATPEAYAALWSFVMNLDLVGKITTWRRPADEPLFHMLAEPRRLSFGLSDALWIRPVDVARALSLRSYAVDGEVAFAVRDSLCPWNEDTYRMMVRSGNAEVRRDDRAMPDLELDVSDLGAAYLGGETFTRLHDAGRVAAASEEALRRADDLFRTSRAPWCPHIF